MIRLVIATILTGTLAITQSQGALAQQPVDAQWIWFDEGASAANVPPGSVWFRREVRAHNPSTTGIVRIACDDRFVLWVNGRRVGEGGGQKSYRFLLSGIVQRGRNVIAVQATSRGGRAGLLVDGEVRSQTGDTVSFDSGADWLATRRPPTSDAWRLPRFDDSDWKPVRVLGPHHSSPWKAIEFQENDMDRFWVPAGFEVRRVAEPKEVGAVSAITWGNRGRLIAAREGGPIQSLSDTDGDGTFDKVVEYSRIVTNCQGLCTVFDDLYAAGDGPQGTGMYRLPDRDRDDRADQVQLVVKYKGEMGEHGPHAIVLGPDGWLYHAVGNNAAITSTPQPTSAARNPYEGDLLRPRFLIFAASYTGVMVPQATIWRFSPDGQRWWMQTCGLRNEYDIALNPVGEVFTFDSDREGDVGMPWYRPIRVCHCVPGAEFGFRTDAAKWPPEYFDSLPSTVDIGRGSPTGVVFYDHRQFPKRYRGALLIGDWSLGRIIAVFLQPSGATFTAEWENLVTGNPLNITDMEVDQDGSLVFSTGGRETEGGIYRVSYTESNGISTNPPARTLDDALAMPQLQTAWAREAVSKIKVGLGDRWQSTLNVKARNGAAAEQIRALTLLSQFGPRPTTGLLLDLLDDQDAAVRSFAVFLLGDTSTPEVGRALARLLKDRDPHVQRRACEALVRSGLEAPVDSLLSLLASDDRWLRFAARVALERMPSKKWRDKVLEAKKPRVLVHGLLALHRLGAAELPNDVALRKELWLLQQTAEVSTQPSFEHAVNVLRMIELTVLAGGKGPALEEIGRILLARFPTGNDVLDREAASLLAVLQVPGAATKIVSAMETADRSSQQMHYALALRYLNRDWSFELNRRILDWYEETQDWEAGANLRPDLASIVAGSLHRFRPEEYKQLLLTWRERPFAARLLLDRAGPEQVSDFMKVMERLLDEFSEQSNLDRREELIGLVIDAVTKSPSLRAQSLLRKLYDEQPDRRGQLARSLARHPSPQNWSYLVRSLQFVDNTTLQICLKALAQIDRRPENPAQTRSAILAGLKLGEQGGLAAANVLGKWTGSKHTADKDAHAALAHYQKWFRRQYPNELPPELPNSDRSKSTYTLQQLVNFLERDPKGGRGDPKRGEAVFAKANCIKCHRFGNQGEAIGPDLSTVRRRFQRKDIIESLLSPSQVISDQYRSLTVATVDGLVHTGMPVASTNDKIVLLLSDASRLEIPRSEVDERQRAQISVMPEGILKTLTLDEIADLFALLETSKSTAGGTSR